MPVSVPGCRSDEVGLISEAAVLAPRDVSEGQRAAISAIATLLLHDSRV